MIPARSRIAKMKSRPYTVAKLVPTIDDGGGPITDVTPNAVNWANVGYNVMFGEFIYSERRILGINTTITLRVTYTGTGLYRLVATNSGTVVFADGTSPDDPVTLGMTPTASNATFTVSNGQYVTFGSTSASNFTVTVVNTSDGNATLDTFDSTYVDVP